MIQAIDNWRDLPVGIYLDILAMQETETDELALQSRIIAALTGLNASKVLDLPIAEYRRLRAAAAFLAEPCPDDLLRIADRYDLDGLVLIPTRDYDELTVAQYVDFQTFSRDPQKYLAELVSVLLVPKGHKYGDGYKPKNVQAAIRDWMNVADAMAILAHFFAWSSSLIEASLASSRLLAGKMPSREQKKMLRKLAKAEQMLSSFAGAGLQTWTPPASSSAAAGTPSGR